jgi:class 3 adenylate cyclase
MQIERDRFDKAVAELRADPNKKRDDSVLRRRDANGRIKVVRISMSRRNGPDNRFEGCFGIMKDGFDPCFPWLGKGMAERIATARNELLKGQSKICTALFADMMGFSKLVDECDHEIVQNLVADFYEQVVETVDAQDGVVVEMSSDEVLALFGILGQTEDEQQSSAEKALRAAIEIHRRFRDDIAVKFLERARTVHAAADLFRPQLGIGLNTGKMLIGPIGKDWLTHFAAVGQSVAQTKRVEELTHDSQRDYPAVLLTESAKVNAEKANPTLSFKSVGRVRLRVHGRQHNPNQVTLFAPTCVVPTDAEIERRLKSKACHIYVSYAWGEDRSDEGKRREDIVDKLCQTIHNTGREIGRDKDRMKSGDSIKGFATEIARSPRIIAVISDKYLHSIYCMGHELFRAYQRCNYQTTEFQQKVIALVMDDALQSLKDQGALTKLARSWQERVCSMAAEMAAADPDHRNHEIWEDLFLFQDMAARLPGMMAALQDAAMVGGLDRIVADGFKEVLERLP